MWIFAVNNTGLKVARLRYISSLFMLSKDMQFRKHLVVMFLEGGQTRKHCFLSMFPEGGQTRKHCFLAMFPEGGQTRKHYFLVPFLKGRQINQEMLRLFIREYIRRDLSKTRLI